MKSKNAVLLLLAAVILFLHGCSCTTWKSFWGRDPEQECATHWKFRKDAPYQPCQAQPISKTERVYPSEDACGKAIQLTKMVPEQITANQPFQYQIKVTNLTKRSLSNVIVTDRVSENMDLKSSSPSVTRMKNNHAFWAIGTLAPEESEIITINALARDTGVLKSCAKVTYDSPTCTEISVVEPALKLTKIAPADSLICDRIPVKYIVKNTGTGEACGIKIKDDLPKGLMTADGKNEISFQVAAIGAGQSQEFNVMLDAKKTGTYISSASATSQNTGTVESNVTQTVVQEPVLQISQSSPKAEYLDKPITYEITVTNKGTTAAQNTVVEARVPDNISFEEATMGGIYTHSSPGKVRWDVGSLEPNASRTLKMTLAGQKTGTLSTMITANAHCAKTVTTSGATSIMGIPAILLEVIDVSDPIEVGNTESYIITVTNQGSAASSNIRLTCMLEEGMEFISATGPSQPTVIGNNINFSPLNSLQPKARAKWQVNVKAASQGDMRFKTSLTTDQLSRPVEETEATKFYK